MLSPLIRLASSPSFSHVRRGCRLARLSAPVLAMLVLTACGVRPVEPPPVPPSELPRVLRPVSQAGPVYTRTVQSGTDTFELQTGSRLFRRAGSPDVDLVGVVHVGEAAYYRAIQQRLDRADLVLFEQVVDERGPDPDAVDPGRRARAARRSAYGRLAASHGLVSQDEGIDYRRPTFRRCDMTLQQMLAKLDAEIAAGGETSQAAMTAREELDSMRRVLRGKSLLVNSALHLVRASHTIRSRMRLSLVSLGDDEVDSEGAKNMHPRLERLITEDRDEHVMRELEKVLRTEPGRRRIAIFYGSGHLPGMERRLRAMGYRPAGEVEWLASIRAHPYSEGIPDEEVREILAGR